ncbi:phosphoethanolamine transferase [Gilliamella sp. wkB72]|uniref:phosphoethanolamine transferase n=1 Tax=Gilliamella sp. wkB72 TaxID=3120265 RepID=UPI00159F1EF5|nr:phosphoethanolamine transferase [Gilliamella apicola]
MDNFKYPAFEFCFDLYSSAKIYHTEQAEQLRQIQQPNTIPIVSVNPKHKTYVIIIGESVRKDYMSAYGFKYNNTPFTNKNASVIWDGLIVPASNTQSSIPHLISQSSYLDDNEVNAQLNNNIIAIANDAGFETFWLSNQGKLGRMEITVPRISAYSKNIFYTKKGEYNGKSTRGKYDTLLLPELDSLLSKKQDKPKLIIMHLIGSHPHFCKRLQFDIQFDLNNENISCYVSSIKETDDLIKSTIDILKKHNEDYSVVYFADHGLSHAEKYQDLRHNWEYQNSYQVPLIFFDSSEKNQIKINKQITGYQFVYLLSHWMGIDLNVHHDYMQYNLIDIPEQKDIQIKDWKNKLYPFDNLKKDPNPY